MGRKQMDLGTLRLVTGEAHLGLGGPGEHWIGRYMHGMAGGARNVPAFVLAALPLS